MLKRVTRKATAILSGRFRPRTVWFTRSINIRPYGFNNGGNLKHSHYFDHVQRTPSFARKIVFRDQFSKECTNSHALWPSDSTARFEPDARDVLFLAGLDWSYLVENRMDSLPNPKINFIQSIRYAHQDTEHYRYLAYRAIRICVSQEVADAISATNQVNGPIITIPNGTDVTPVNPAEGLPRPPAGYDCWLQAARSCIGFIPVSERTTNRPSALHRIH